jgi:hypothetical protein
MFFADSKKKWGGAGEISTCPRVQIIRLADLAPCSNKTPFNHQKRKVSNLKSKDYQEIDCSRRGNKNCIIWNLI